uniref:Uncharacterized protein n=1 Tax=Nothobranchius furzeri TaxID=105023 RepID=A0A8C6LTX8_NOTFU
TLSSPQVFERRSLTSKWVKSHRWSGHQRKAGLQDLVSSYSVDQLRFLSISVSRQRPLQAADSTSLFPRTLSLYSLLPGPTQPPSLCPGAWWSWTGWLGWCITFSPPAFEQSVWKRRYVQTVQELKLSLQQVRAAPERALLTSLTFSIMNQNI